MRNLRVALFLIPAFLLACAGAEPSSPPQKGLHESAANVIDLLNHTMRCTSPVSAETAKKIRVRYSHRYQRGGILTIGTMFNALVAAYSRDNPLDGTILRAAETVSPIFVWTQGMVSPARWGKRGVTFGSVVLVTLDQGQFPVELYVHELVHVYQNRTVGVVLFNAAYLTNSFLKGLLKTFEIKYDFIRVMEDQATSIQERFWFWLATHVDTGVPS
jgi:hypothetical protein